MSFKVTRRALARYAAERLLAGDSAGHLAKQLAAICLETGRVHETEYLLSDIGVELEHRGALAVGRVTSANPLTEELRRELITRLKQATDTTAVLLDEQVDKSLIGGLRVETANRVWDDTIRRQLDLLKEAG